METIPVDPAARRAAIYVTLHREFRGVLSACTRTSNRRASNKSLLTPCRRMENCIRVPLSGAQLDKYASGAPEHLHSEYASLRPLRRISFPRRSCVRQLPESETEGRRIRAIEMATAICSIICSLPNYRGKTVADYRRRVSAGNLSIFYVYKQYATFVRRISRQSFVHDARLNRRHSTKFIFSIRSAFGAPKYHGERKNRSPSPIELFCPACRKSLGFCLNKKRHDAKRDTKVAEILKNYGLA